MQAEAVASLPYHEPGIVTILVYSSLLLLLNAVNFFLDKALYCGLLGQVFVGVAWGTPGAKWLGTEAEGVIVQLGYLGLLLLVYEGGLSTSFASLRANLLLSVGVAITGVCLPIALSFVLQRLSDAAPIQCFAAGAALCATSLGTIFTVLTTSGLIKSRLGVVLASAAMMDDVVGLVMVQVISNLGRSSTSISAVVIVRPLVVSLGLAVFAPLLCIFLAKPITIRADAYRAKQPFGVVNRILKTPEVAFGIHTLVLLGYIAAASYAGTSNLFAAYVAGASISWWDSEVPHTVTDGNISTSSTPAPTERNEQDAASPAIGRQDEVTSSPPVVPTGYSGPDIYEKYYSTPVNRVLRPFFFASIGFSIPITQLFSSEIVWKGLVYTVLMMFGKLACGAWLVRLSGKARMPNAIKFQLLKASRPRMNHFWGIKFKGSPPAAPTRTPDTSPDATDPACPGPQSESSESTPSASNLSSAEVPEVTDHRVVPAGINPQSMYPASIVGCAMVSRGEIGFLISSIAESNGIFASDSDRNSSSDIFLIVTWAIVLCTILGPLAVGLLVQRVKKLQRGVEREGRLVRGDVLGVWGVN